MVILTCLVPFTCLSQNAFAQKDSSLVYANRKKALWIGLAGSYSIGSIALYNSWYKNYEREKFHFFNDSREWRQMDKVGHMQATYSQVKLLNEAHLWAGYDSKASNYRSAAIAILFQSTIEVMDGFSSQWGFSWYDLSANIIGAGTFLLQEEFLKKQLIKIKFSYFPQSTPVQTIFSTDKNNSTTLRTRQDELFGKPIYQKILKNYNHQTIWLSSNPSDWWLDSWWPDFLSIALGYSVDNLYGGFNNSWTTDNAEYILQGPGYERHSQFILALDYDLEKINTESKFLSGLLTFLNVFKWPAPAIQYRTTGEFSFHLIFKS